MKVTIEIIQVSDGRTSWYEWKLEDDKGFIVMTGLQDERDFAAAEATHEAMKFLRDA